MEIHFLGEKEKLHLQKLVYDTQMKAGQPTQKPSSALFTPQSHLSKTEK